MNLKSSLLGLLMVFTQAFSIGFSANAAAKVEFLNPKPGASSLPFSQAVKVNGTLYMSGQIGFDNNKGRLVSGGFEAETHQVLKNIQAVVVEHGYQMSDVVKCMVMLTDIKDFAAFNKIYKQYFKAPYPARSAFAVKELALNSLVEVECIAAK